MAIPKPQALVFQEFNTVPSEITDPLRAVVMGPNAILRRYTDPDEKLLINLGEYNRLIDQEYSWPNRPAGGVVDQSYTRVFMEKAKLLYFEDLIGDASGGRGTVTAVSGRTNWVRSSTVSFKANGTSYPRSALMHDRDAQIGDRVYIRGIADPEGDCEEVELWSYIAGFAAEQVASEIGECRTDTNNQATVTASTTIERIDGPLNCVGATANGSAYDGLADGYVSETYTIEVVKSSVAGCQAARLRVTSASGTDDQDEVEPEDFGNPTEIGTRGLTVTFTNTPGECSLSASSESVEDSELIVGQKWQVEVQQAFEKACCEAAGTYGGDENDVYVVEVTKGGVWADLPAISVSTVKGLDFSGPTEVTGTNVAVPIGSNGVTIKFVDCFGDSSSMSSWGTSESALVELGDDTLAGLRKGDKFYVTVTSAANGAVRTLILKHNVPADIRSAADLDLRLFIEKDIEVSEDRLDAPPAVNWSQEATQILINSGITAFDASWTENDVELPMPVYGGTLFVHYRAWVQDLIDDLIGISDPADLSQIPGPTDPDNPLKYAWSKALANSNGTIVRGIAVADPSDVDDWVTALTRIKGREDLYNVVPLTYTAEVLQLVKTHVKAESSPEAGNWKGMFLNLQARSAKMVIGQSENNLLDETSTDGEVVLATLADDPNASGTQYTLLEVTSGNALFLTRGVEAGDVLRYLFTTDAFGNEEYLEFVVDEVISEDSLRLLEGYDTPITEPQRIEIWHTLSKTEIVDDLKEQAQAYADRRVCAVWPDTVGVGGQQVAGYYLCAALAGLVSGVVPHQGLTNLTVSGFDDYSRSSRFFNSDQLDSLQDGGVWIVTEDRDGTPHTYHALTTDMTDVNSREEMIRRNVDSISKYFLAQLRPYIGTSNVTPPLIRRLEFEVTKIIEFLKGNGNTDQLGSQLIDGSITSIGVHPLLADRVVIVLALTVPAPLNNIELHLVV